MSTIAIFSSQHNNLCRNPDLIIRSSQALDRQDILITVKPALLRIPPFTRYLHIIHILSLTRTSIISPFASSHALEFTIAVRPMRT
jgi:hypothetical protein